jgi:hypothetical protein
MGGVGVEVRRVIGVELSRDCRRRRRWSRGPAALPCRRTLPSTAEEEDPSGRTDHDHRFELPSRLRTPPTLPPPPPPKTLADTCLARTCPPTRNPSNTLLLFAHLPNGLLTVILNPTRTTTIPTARSPLSLLFKSQRRITTQSSSSSTTRTDPSPLLSTPPTMAMASITAPPSRSTRTPAPPSPTLSNDPHPLPPSLNPTHQQ